jgi:phosphotransferase system HPr-like phosphotransfer protein
MPENDQTETVENVASGVSITSKLKRGSGTRDQDEIKIKAKGKTAEEAIENMDAVIEEAEEWADDLREVQPEGGDA